MLKHTFESGRPKLRDNDVCERDLKALQIDLNRWDTLASVRLAWRQAVQPVQQGLSPFEERHALQTEVKRQRRKVQCQGERPVMDYTAPSVKETATL